MASVRRPQAGLSNISIWIAASVALLALPVVALLAGAPAASAAEPTSAGKASTGGMATPTPPRIARLLCRTSCPPNPKPSSVPGSTSAAPNSVVRIRGQSLAGVRWVEFDNGLRANARSVRTTRLDFRVPSNARSGRLRVVLRNGRRSARGPRLRVVRPPVTTTPLSGGGTGTSVGSNTPGQWKIPLPSGYIMTSKFYEDRGYPHAGVDLAISSGTPIYAAADGTVVTAEFNYGGYGNYTCVDHGADLVSCYAHQSSMAVTEGQRVTRGQRIGAVGCTGRCTGPHLHFEVRYQQAIVCPAPYVGVEGDKWCAAGSPGLNTVGTKRSARAAQIERSFRPPIPPDAAI